MHNAGKPLFARMMSENTTKPSRTTQSTLLYRSYLHNRWKWFPAFIRQPCPACCGRRKLKTLDAPHIPVHRTNHGRTIRQEMQSPHKDLRLPGIVYRQANRIDRVRPCLAQRNGRVKYLGRLLWRLVDVVKERMFGCRSHLPQQTTLFDNG